MPSEIASHDPQLISTGPSPSLGETVPAGEAADIQAIVRLVEAHVRDAAKNGIARRDAHSKGHGCVRAEFQVLEGLAPELRIGIFAEPRRYAAVIRFSNGAGVMAPDKQGDSRGMAIKLLDVAGSPSGTQDFVLVDHSTFVIRNVADYRELQAASPQWKFFLPDWNPFRLRLHELLITLAIQRQVVKNPLSQRYWSMTPFAFGKVACKFSARPVGPLSAFQDTEAADFLRGNLENHLATESASFDFMVQLRTQPDAMPIEDPTIDWREAVAPFRTLARITIPPQPLGEADFCENLSFTPWHGLPAHRPLGGLNRARREVYEAISRLRHTMNAKPRREPTEADIISMAASHPTQNNPYLTQQ
ncbi:catalase family protein (plasmid) [Methylobacterium currus]|uniref:catalase family protein n=1 Tax=Methylobacterium currus TaxID=2051553 RepID=UPI001E5BE495|nr:catalase family protein [Methylobacterium currus]UHC20418.1 catalase family protein [Methylobacterium currus]